DVEDLPEKLEAIPETHLWRRFWRELPQRHTESWYVHLAKARSWPEEERKQYEAAYRDTVCLVCRPNLDVYYGFAGQYTHCHGNLRRDGVNGVLSRAMAAGAFSYDEVWFPGAPVLPIGELATRYSAAHSQRIHPDAFSIRNWWATCARRVGLSS